jgi:hypothetical protein
MFDQVVRQRDKLKADGAKLAVSIDAQQGLLRQQ